MQMMNILKPIAFDVIHCVSQLFDYYLYAVYTFFGRNDMVWSCSLLSLLLCVTELCRGCTGLFESSKRRLFRCQDPRARALKRDAAHLSPLNPALFL